MESIIMGEFSWLSFLMIATILANFGGFWVIHEKIEQLDKKINRANSRKTNDINYQNYYK